MKRAEMDWIEAPRPTVGSAEAVAEEHGRHAFLYIPDLSSQTGWASHAVQTKEPPRETRSVGFQIRRGRS